MFDLWILRLPVHMYEVYVCDAVAAGDVRHVLSVRNQATHKRVPVHTTPRCSWPRIVITVKPAPQGRKRCAFEESSGTKGQRHRDVSGRICPSSLPLAVRVLVHNHTSSTGTQYSEHRDYDVTLRCCMRYVCPRRRGQGAP